MRKRFEGDYVRGGSRTLFMNRQDVVETIAMIMLRYPGNIVEIMREARTEANRVEQLRSETRKNMRADEDGDYS